MHLEFHILKKNVKLLKFTFIKITSKNKFPCKSDDNSPFLQPWEIIKKSSNDFTYLSVSQLAVPLGTNRRTCAPQTKGNSLSRPGKLTIQREGGDGEKKNLVPQQDPLAVVEIAQGVCGLCSFALCHRYSVKMNSMHAH